MLPVFVYGTLLTGFGNHSRYIAPYPYTAVPAQVRGVIYHLPEGYPAMLAQEPESRAGQWVRGELVIIPPHVYPEVLAGLDELEDFFGPGDPRNLYEREEVRVLRLDNRKWTKAWCYRMHGQHADRARRTGVFIPEGDWRRWWNDR